MTLLNFSYLLVDEYMRQPWSLLNVRGHPERVRKNNSDDPTHYTLYEREWNEQQKTPKITDAKMKLSLQNKRGHPKYKLDVTALQNEHDWQTS